MSKRKVVFLTVFIILMIDLVKGQSYREDFKSVFNAWNNSHHVISCNINFRYYARQGGNVLDSLSGTFTFYGDEFYYLIGNQEFLRNDKYYIVINHEEKNVLVENKDMATYPMFDINKLEKLVQSNEVSIQQLPAKSGESGYKLKQINGAETVELWFRKKDSVITKLAMDFGERKVGNEIHKPYIIVTYSNYKLHSSGDAATIFMAENYFSRVNGKMLLSGRLKGYLLLGNQL